MNEPRFYWPLKPNGEKGSGMTEEQLEHLIRASGAILEYELSKLLERRTIANGVEA